MHQNDLKKNINLRQKNKKKLNFFKNIFKMQKQTWHKYPVSFPKTE